MHAWINITHPGFSDAEVVIDEREDEWIPWEQMVATLRAKGKADGRAALLAREVVELRGEVAKLKPLEMILDKGGDPVQHLSEAVRDLSAKLRSAEDAIRIMDREYFGLNNKFREARAEIDLLKETAQASAVVVLELTDGEIEERFESSLNPDIGGIDEDKREWCYKDCRWAYNLATSRIRAIPADRVLVSRDLLRQARDNCQATLAESDISPLVKDYRKKLLDWLDDALRANQGGDEHA